MVALCLNVKKAAQMGGLFDVDLSRIESQRAECPRTESQRLKPDHLNPDDYATSKRSRFMTLVHAATKSLTNFALASSAA